MAKIAMVTLGCSKNLVDAEQMLGLVSEAGHTIVTDETQADYIIVNTCAFIDAAKEESIAEILRVAQITQKTGAKLIVSGCLAERYREEIIKEMPEVDAVIGVTGFPELLSAMEKAKTEKTVYCPSRDLVLPELPRLQSTPFYTAYLKIAEGCSNRCAYCAIPNIRGKYRSRPMEAVLAEAEAMAKNGVKEVIVIAQDTSRYGTDWDRQYHLPTLLSSLCRIDGIEWIRVHYLYPECVTEELLKVFKKEEKLLPYFDIPIQHASDAVLKRMGRKTNRKALDKLIRTIRAEVKDAVIRTTVMVGYPGETDEDFDSLLSFVRESAFERLGAFIYSEQEGTPASKLSDKVPELVAQKRFDRLMKEQKNIAQSIAKQKIGTCVKVLVTGFEDLFYEGRSYADSPDVDPKVYFSAEREVPVGSFVTVEVLNTDEYDLIGKEIEESEEHELAE